jgi:enamine deaminase RidA (YjgF/YER057c/UK114 family)
VSAEARLKELGIELPTPAKPAGVYAPAVRTGNLLFTSGHVSIRPDGTKILGKLGDTLTVEQGYEAARVTGLALLATIRASLGSLDRVKRVVKTLGLVNAVPDFTQHPAVINGCSELLARVFGEELGVGARSAFGAGSLPLGVATEIEVILEVE